MQASKNYRGCSNYLTGTLKHGINVKRGFALWAGPETGPPFLLGFSMGNGFVKKKPSAPPKAMSGATAKPAGKASKPSGKPVKGKGKGC